MAQRDRKSCDVLDEYISGERGSIPDRKYHLFLVYGVVYNDLRKEQKTDQKRNVQSIRRDCRS